MAALTPQLDSQSDLSGRPHHVDLSEKGYSLNQPRYDLRKLRAHGLISSRSVAIPQTSVRITRGALGLEGIVSKWPGAPYRSGRDWIKVKNLDSLGGAGLAVVETAVSFDDGRPAVVGGELHAFVVAGTEPEAY
jgi:hypothetical protein